MASIWDEWLEHHGGTRLPAVVPLVLSNSTEPWNAPTELAELFALPSKLRESLGAYLPRFRFVLDDLARATPEQVASRRHLTVQAQVAAGLLRLLRDEVNGERLLLLPMGALGDEDLIAVVHYVMLAKPQGGEKVAKAMLDHLGEQGRQVDDIWEIVREHSRAEGRAEAVVRALELRGLDVPQPVRDRVLACRDLPVLDRYLERAMRVSTASDIFADG
jgi:hypothetical protein